MANTLQQYVPFNSKWIVNKIGKKNKFALFNNGSDI